LEEVGCSAFNDFISVFASEATARGRVIPFVKQLEYCCLALIAAN
jgi:hypothetical protein